MKQKPQHRFRNFMLIAFAMFVFYIGVIGSEITIHFNPSKAEKTAWNHFETIASRTFKIGGMAKDLLLN